MPDLTIKKWAGLRNDISPERLEAGDMVAAKNVLLRNDGKVARRMGQLERQATMGGRIHSLWSDGDQLGLCVRARTLSMVDPETCALTIIVLDLQSDAPMNYSAVNGVVYCTNGTNQLAVEDGRAHKWGIVPPGLQDATVSPGSLAAGRYQWAMTYVRESGEESGATGIGLLELTGYGGIYWPNLEVSSDPSVTHKALYVSTADGEILYRALVLTNATTQANFLGGDENLAFPLETLYLGPPPPGQALAYYAGRMWVARDSDIYGSAPFSAELFDLREFIPARGKVTMMAPRPDDKAMLIGSEKGVGWLVGGELETMEYQHALDDPVLPGSLVWVPGQQYSDGQAKGTELPMWAGREGLYTALPPYWTIEPITLDRVQQKLQGRAAAVFDRARGQYLATITT